MRRTCRRVGAGAGKGVRAWRSAEEGRGDGERARQRKTSLAAPRAAPTFDSPAAGRRWFSSAQIL